MDKIRVILAVALSMLVLFTWSAWVSKFYPVDNKGVIEKSSMLPPVISQVSSLPAPAAVQVALSTYEFSQDNQKITFIEPYAAIKEATFPAYQSYVFPLGYGLLLGSTGTLFKKDSYSSQEARFSYADKEKKISKEFLFDPANYSIKLDIKIQNLSDRPITMNWPLTLAVLNFSGDQMQMRFQDVTLAAQDKVVRSNGRKDFTFAGVKFLGIRDRYFCAIMQPETDKGNYSAFIKKINAQESEVGLVAKDFSLSPGEEKIQKFSIYLGPQDLKLINQTNSEWLLALNYGFFGAISQLILQLLEWLFHLVHNWGLAIILLTLLINIVLYPLTLKQLRGMKDMQEKTSILQPQLEEIKRKYKNDPQKLNKETMELYRKYKINPLGGCLPMLLQIPIFIALYHAIMRSVLLKGAPFLWIKDLSEPDRLFMLPPSWPVKEVNVLPILMAAAMLLQQLLSTSRQSLSAEQAQQQKIMGIMLPAFLLIAFYKTSSGFNLYFLTNTAVMLFYQLRIIRPK
jgi:YidC/Oxa1 family membrane protein insertase